MPPATPVFQRDLGRCEEVAGLASEFLEEDLEDSTARAVAAHLRTCRDCLRQYAELALTIAAVRHFGPRMGFTDEWPLRHGGY